ncbi:uncharacterized protein LOC123529544 [Mercenaria mercenaria]|uniref:uncharacterized protein LOC123529544 n=1 Tax=Mercenaria mercenaria TaxID=6596 RepID=UPI00234F5CCE|nr:uncharacterized protein LOC123529544 [Mercenaria mercenaria]
MNSFYYVNGCFVFVCVYLISTFTFSEGSGIYCDTGQHVTLKVPVNFTVRERPIFDCIYGSWSEERRSYPGSPESLTYNISLINKSFTLTWKPPDDSSSEHVTGFFLKMFIEEIGDTMSFDPSACYTVDSKLAAEFSTGKVTQDAVFHLDCKMEQTLNVNITVKTLPTPAHKSFNFVYVNFQDTTTKQIITLPNPKTKLISEDPKVEDRTASLMAISVGVVVISTITLSVVVCIVCKRRSHDYGITSSFNGNKQHDDKIIKESYHQVSNSPNTAPAINNDGNGKLKADERTEYSAPNTCTGSIIAGNTVQNCTGKTSVLKGCTDISNEIFNIIHVTDTNVKSVPIPEKYRLQLQMINLDS